MHSNKRRRYVKHYTASPIHLTYLQEDWRVLKGFWPISLPERIVARPRHTDELAIRGYAAKAQRALSAVVLPSHLEWVCSYRSSATSSRIWKGGEVFHLTINVLLISNAYEDQHFDSFIQSGCSALRIAALDFIVEADCCSGLTMASSSFTVDLQGFLVPQCQAGYDCLARTMVVPSMVDVA